MKLTGTQPAEQAGRDERLYDERVHLARPGRLIAGLVMICIAVIWIVLQNILDPSAPRAGSNQTTPTAGSSIPSTAIAQRFVGGIANVAVQGRLNQLNGRVAPAGSFFLVMAVQVGNRSSVPLHVTATDFTLSSGARKIGSGAALTGHDAAFTLHGIPPKATAEGDLAFFVPSTASSLVLGYTPQIHGAIQLKWSVSAAGT